MSGQSDERDEDFYIEETLAHADRQILEVDDMRFTWWTVSSNPAFVTVSSTIVGHDADLTHGDPEECARQLAGKLLREYRNRRRTR